LLSSASDIISTSLRFAGEITDLPTSDNVSEYRTAALGYLNSVYLAILSAGNEFDIEMGEPFAWAISAQPGIFQLLPSIDANVTIAHGATSGTFSAIPQDQYGNNISLAGRYLRVNNLADVYRIVTHTSGTTAFTIDFAYIQASQTGILATAYALDYQLNTGILRLVSPMRIYQLQSNIYTAEIVGSNMAAMRREFPIPYLQSRYPDRFCIKSQDSTNDYMVIQINTNPLDNARVEYDFVPFPTLLTDSTASIPVVPRKHLMTMAYLTAQYICVDKNDQRAANYLALGQAGLRAIVAEEKKIRADLNRERGRIIPRMDLLRRRSFPWWWGRW
jgi:hypothetical protein